jgi:hypothetical protein
MSIRRVLYPSIFNVPAPPPPVPAGNIPSNYARSPIVVLQPQVISGQHNYPIQPPPAPIVYPPVFGRSPLMVLQPQIIAGQHNIAPFPPAPPVINFAWSESPTRTLGRFRIALERLGFDDTFQPILQQGPVFSESPLKLVKPFRVALERIGFDDTFAPVLQQGPVFSESLQQFKRPFLLNQFADIAFLQIAYTANAAPWGQFSESPWTFKQARASDQQPLGFQFVPPVTVTPVFSEHPIALKRPAPSILPWTDISFLQIAYTPSAFGFSESQWTFRRPFQLKQWSDISFLQIAYNPAIWGMFSEQPAAQKKPTPSLVPWADYPFQPIVLRPLVFSESPTRVQRPFLLNQFADVSFLQIAYTPGPMVFSESPWQFKQPHAFDQPGFISFTIAVPTPSFWPWSESPTALKRPAPSLVPFVDFPWQPIVLRPLVFSESPTALKPPFLLKQWSDISFLQIAYTPGPLVFSESPYALKGPRPFEQQPMGLQGAVVVTPTNWGMFSESPWQFKAARPSLVPWADISFVQIAYTPSALVFSEQQRAFAPSRALRQWSDISFLQIAYTPGPLVFSEQQWTFRLPRLLDQPGFVAPAVVPAPTFWPWSESPTALKRPTPLYEWKDISFLQIAYTPQTWGMFSESPWQFKRPFVLRQWADYPFLPISLVPLVFSESPWWFKSPRALLPFIDFTMMPAVLTPGPLVFSESPILLKPSKALLPWADISFLLGAVTPSAFWMGQREDMLMLVRPAINVTILSPTGNISWLQPPIFVAKGRSYGYIIG